MMNEYMTVVTKKYAQFDGRASRQEFWMFTLFNILITIGFGVLAGVSQQISDGLAMIVSLVQMVYGLGVLIPGIAVAIRRLHDSGKSGWMLLLGLIPCVGAIILLVFYVAESQPGTNQYGPNPYGM